MATDKKVASICVFCGSSNGKKPEYGTAAAALGAELAMRGLRLVYGGGDVGTMGILARSVLAAGGKVTGIIPRKLYELVDHVELTELVVAADMHERKARMYDTADAFVALPGGIGTLDEFFETWTWRGIGYHAKPVGMLNVAGYFTPLLAFLGTMVDEGFAGGAPPDIFYLSANSIETFAKEGDLLPYASSIAKPSAFYSTLVKADTYNHTWMCVPKDFANLALEINTTMWKAAPPCTVSCGSVAVLEGRRTVKPALALASAAFATLCGLAGC